MYLLYKEEIKTTTTTTRGATYVVLFLSINYVETRSSNCTKYYV